MSQRDTWFREHAVWARMEALGSAIDQAVGREGIEVDHVAAWERVRTVLTFLGKRLSGTHAELISSPALDSIAAQLEGATTSAQSAATDANASIIAAASANVDSILKQMPALNFPFVADDLHVLREAGATYRSSLEEATKAYRDAVDTQTQQMGQVIDKLRSQVTEAAKRVSEMTAEAAAERARLTSLTSEFQAQFSTAQDTRSKEYNEAQASRQERFGGVVAEHTKSLAEQSAEYKIVCSSGSHCDEFYDDDYFVGGGSHDCITALLENLSLFGGLEGSKQPQDFGVNAHFGGRFHANMGLPLLPECG
jgi:hypothetical protein